MAAVKAASYAVGATGRSDFDHANRYVSGVSYTTPALDSPVGSNKKLTLFTSTKSVGNEPRVGATSPTSPASYRPNALRPSLRNPDSSMGSYSSTTTIPAATATRTDSRLNKLHKRGSSGSSLPGSNSPFLGSRSQYTATPYATQEERFPDLSSTPPSSSTPKIKPYLRKISAGRDDEEQGRLDLSKSVSENGALPGLGIQDFGARTASEVNFPQTGRRTPHTRTTSVGSQVSTGSGSFRPFVHPMRQMPNRPYTPPIGHSDVSSLNDDEAQESSDIVTDDDVQLSQPYRNRSTSLASQHLTQHTQPTPLSQSHTAQDLGYIPKLTSTSQTNLSIKSGRSAKSSTSKTSKRSKLGLRTRSHTNPNSTEVLPSPSSRTSFDKAFSFVSRRSDTDPLSRDERIRAARRKFDEKEASKDRRQEKLELKRRETEIAKSVKSAEKVRRQSEVSERGPKISKSETRRGSESASGARKKLRRESVKSEKEPVGILRSRSYEDTRMVDLTALPTHSKAERGGSFEKRTMRQEKKSQTPSQSGWTRFSTWLQTRMLSCGGKRG